MYKTATQATLAFTASTGGTVQRAWLLLCRVVYACVLTGVLVVHATCNHSLLLGECLGVHVKQGGGGMWQQHVALSVVCMLEGSLWGHILCLYGPLHVAC